MNAAVVSGLAVSRACDYTDALPVLRPPDRVDGVAGTFGGVEGCRTAGAAPGGGGAAAAEPQAEAGLGGPDGDRRPGAAAPETVADESAGDAGYVVALAPASSPLAVDLSPSRRAPDGRRPGRGTDRADGAGEPGLGLQADPGRTARPRLPGRYVYGAEGAEAAGDTACAEPLPVDVAAVPAQSGIHHVGVRLLPRRLRGDLAACLRVLRDRGEHPPRPCPGRDRAPGRGVDRAASPEPADGPGGAREQVPVPGPGPGRAVHRGVRRGAVRCRDRGGEDPSAQSAGERLCRALGAHSPGRGHRP